jgi:hypothetical protein
MFRCHIPIEVLTMEALVKCEELVSYQATKEPEGERCN